jgi:hypothetical protein
MTQANRKSAEIAAQLRKQINELFDIPICKRRLSRAAMREQIAVDAAVSEPRAERARMLRRYRSARPPAASEEAGRVAFSHDAARHAQFRALLQQLGSLLNMELATDSGGQKAKIAALEFAIGLIKRIPMTEFDRFILIESLNLIKHDLEFGPLAIRPRNKPQSRTRRLRHRCVLAVKALEVLQGKEKPEAIDIVFKKAKPTAKFIDFKAQRPRKKENSWLPPDFTEETVKGWYAKDKTSWNKWSGGGWLQEGLDVVQLMSGIVGWEIPGELPSDPSLSHNIRDNVEFLAAVERSRAEGTLIETLLRSLEVGNIGLPLKTLFVRLALSQ